jgi:hypothetical protein
MRRPRFATTLAVAMLVAAPSWTLAQDANEGVDGSALVRRAILDALVTKCAARFPEQKAALESGFAAWKQERSGKLQVADAALAALSAEQRDAFQKAIEPSLTTTGILFDQAEKEGKTQAFCAQSIAEFGDDKQQQYMDADNFDEAVGMYAQNLVMMATLTPLCTSAFPDIEERMATGTSRWQELDASILSRTKAEMAAIRKANPEMVATMETQMRQAAQSAFDAVTKMGEGTARTYCLKQVDELVDGTRRQQTPKMYQLLERGRGK